MLYLSDLDRNIYFIVFLILVIIAIFGNIAAIYVTIKRKHRFYQKTCLISLALSDLIMAIAYSINNLESFSHALINWTLGSFMCSFIPMLQIYGVIASTTAIVAIAIDRYRNVVHALTKRWNPQKTICIIGVITLWISCIGISYPIFPLFGMKKIFVLRNNESGYPYIDPLYMCVSDKKKHVMYYYIAISALIFTPLLIIFLYLYYKLAKLVWYHRKPLGNCQTINETSQISETSTTQIKTTEDINKSIQNQKLKTILNRTKNIHVERKIRTFKIIVVLIIIFCVCRIPYWTFNIVKLTGAYNKYYHWILTYSFNGLALLNTAINPFVYVFLNPTLKALMKTRKNVCEFISNVCCCFCSNAEFEEFERHYPFIVDVYEKKKCDTMPGNSNTRVKSEYADVVQMFGSKGNTLQGKYKPMNKY